MRDMRRRAGGLPAGSGAPLRSGDGGAAMLLSERVVALKTILDAMPGATTVARAPPRSTKGPMALDYKVLGKTFAILQVRGFENVILKCDPHLAEILREQYAGVGHRSHLDRRYWICVSLDADVPADETERLAAQSYELVRAGLTKKQRMELAALG
jgi:predicted DNA-binding protein (MmcQ/YjbR family)